MLWHSHVEGERAHEEQSRGAHQGSKGSFHTTHQRLITPCHCPCRCVNAKGLLGRPHRCNPAPLSSPRSSPLPSSPPPFVLSHHYGDCRAATGRGALLFRWGNVASVCVPTGRRRPDPPVRARPGRPRLVVVGPSRPCPHRQGSTTPTCLCESGGRRVGRKPPTKWELVRPVPGIGALLVVRGECLYTCDWHVARSLVAVSVSPC